jgi:hypothetical protein
MTSECKKKMPYPIIESIHLGVDDFSNNSVSVDSQEDQGLDDIQTFSFANKLSNSGSQKVFSEDYVSFEGRRKSSR